jgi:hypothetical protein
MRIRDGDGLDPGSRMEKSRTRDKHPGSATLRKFIIKLLKICVLDLGSRLLHLHVHFNLLKCCVLVQIPHPFTNLLTSFYFFINSGLCTAVLVAILPSWTRTAPFPPLSRKRSMRQTERKSSTRRRCGSSGISGMLIWFYLILSRSPWSLPLKCSKKVIKNC